mgnify:FL=1
MESVYIDFDFEDNKLLFTNRIEAMLWAIDKSKMSDLDIERKTGISRSQIFRWKKGEIHSVHHKTFETIISALQYGYKITSEGIKVITTYEKDNKMSIEINPYCQKIIDSLMEHNDSLRNDKMDMMEQLAAKERRVQELEELLREKKN